MKYLLFSALLLASHGIFSQNKIEWSDDYKLKVEDFQAKAPNVGSGQTIYPSTTIEFKYMNYQLAFSNLNANVSCSFLPSSSWLDDGSQTEQLLSYAQINWDLNELAARKLRKAFRDNRRSLNQAKMSLLHEQVMAEIVEIQGQYSKETNFGTIPEKQKEWIEKTKGMLNEYVDYCKTCKPPKKKKKKRKK